MGKVEEFFLDEDAEEMIEVPHSGWKEWEKSVSQPEHYKKHPVETIEILETLLNTYSDSLTPFQIYCWGTEIAYRLRAGHKGEAVEDIAKAMKYHQFREEAE